MAPINTLDLSPKALSRQNILLSPQISLKIKKKNSGASLSKQHLSKFICSDQIGMSKNGRYAYPNTKDSGVLKE